MVLPQMPFCNISTVCSAVKSMQITHSVSKTWAQLALHEVCKVQTLSCITLSAEQLHYTMQLHYTKLLYYTKHVQNTDTAMHYSRWQNLDSKPR